MRITDAYLIRSLTTLPNGTIQAERTDIMLFIEPPPNGTRTDMLMAMVHYALEEGDADLSPVITSVVEDANGVTCGSGMTTLHEPPDGTRQRRANVVFMATLKERGTYTLRLSLLPVAVADGSVAVTHRLTFAVR